MNNLVKALEKRGLTRLQAVKMGAPYHTILKQCQGIRGVGPKSAILYEKLLGIPRSELRPDLWPPEEARPKEPA